MPQRHLLLSLAAFGVCFAPAVSVAVGVGVAVAWRVNPVQAQLYYPYEEVRALNLARNHAVRLNGGLSNYRPANCMFTTSAASNPCLVGSNREGYTYRFLGGPPGWEQFTLPPTMETEILIGPEGKRVLKVIYNGPPRTADISG